MNIDLDTSTLSLSRDGLIALRDAQGTTVTALSGALWITEDGAQRDVILEAGELMKLRRPGLTLIMALEPGSLRLSERRERSLDRVGRWLAGWLPGSLQPRIG